MRFLVFLNSDQDALIVKISIQNLSCVPHLSNQTGSPLIFLVING